ncbi:helix-turn-helix domain-containing protein [Actinoplanes sp. LDG1-06]|uniref:Helix-turn-helix domain-containing protein n=1 Tax=Paractinoplanes ovalisporus TaxID=2810368 RepID=A0ABS2AMI6_9ACTN|nr:helix-turn-helix domain-containing protein [Actinoplanes ovalisporus]MBM2621039.1 helix-turn-helix domain-containing protein [Actinoplanes ovalisporus]
MESPFTSGIHSREEFGAALEWLRQRHARVNQLDDPLSLREIANRTGGGVPNTIRNYLNGRTVPPRVALERLAELFGADAAQLDALLRAREELSRVRTFKVPPLAPQPGPAQPGSEQPGPGQLAPQPGPGQPGSEQPGPGQLAPQPGPGQPGSEQPGPGQAESPLSSATPPEPQQSSPQAPATEQLNPRTTGRQPPLGSQPPRRTTRRRLILAVAATAVLASAATLVAVLLAREDPPATSGPVPVIVQNMVAVGADGLVEDETPAYLSARPVPRCAANGCKLAGTEMWSGAALTVECRAEGSVMHNYNVAEGTANPHSARSTIWYRARTADGRAGFVSEVYLAPRFRGGLDLPRCS